MKSKISHFCLAPSIGFCTQPSLLLEDNEQCTAIYPSQYGLAFSGDISMISGQALTGIIQPTLNIPPYHQVPHGSYLNFDKCPIELQPISALWNYLNVRNIAPKGSKTDGKKIVCKVQQSVELEKKNILQT